METRTPALPAVEKWQLPVTHSIAQSFGGWWQILTVAWSRRLSTPSLPSFTGTAPTAAPCGTSTRYVRARARAVQTYSHGMAYTESQVAVSLEGGRGIRSRSAEWVRAAYSTRVRAHTAPHSLASALENRTRAHTHAVARALARAFVHAWTHRRVPSGVPPDVLTMDESRRRRAGGRGLRHIQPGTVMNIRAEATLLAPACAQPWLLST